MRRIPIANCNSPAPHRVLSRHRRAAFTLLEVLLALGLSSVLIGVLAMAIRTQLKASDSGRVDVARAQLARALLKRIGDDVRAAVWYEPIDPNAMVVPPPSSSQGGASNSSSSGTSMASSGGGSGGSSSGSGSSGGGSSGGSSSGGGGSSGSSSSGGSSSGTTSSTGTTSTTSTTSTTITTSTTSTSSTTSSGSGGGGGGSGGGGGGGGGSGSSSASTTITTTQNLSQAAMMYATPIMPGLFGGPNWLQVDVSRLPRADQMMIAQGMQGTSQGGSQSSDVKTVTYYMAGGSGMPQSAATSVAGGGGGKGLLRREISRASSVSATSGGNSSSTAFSSPEALAPEVARIELQYSNGSGYQSTWDSRQRYGLPKAVKIRVAFLADALEPADNEAVSLIDQRNVVTYELVVAPAAWRPMPAWVGAMSSMTGSGGSSSSSTTTGTGTF